MKTQDTNLKVAQTELEIFVEKYFKQCDKTREFQVKLKRSVTLYISGLLGKKTVLAYKNLLEKQRAKTYSMAERAHKKMVEFNKRKGTYFDGKQ